MTALEIVVQDPEGISICAQGGVDRIELCSALGVGGLTSSAGLVENAVASGASVHVLIRPRAGNFSYSVAELLTMVADVEHSIYSGAAGVVIGAIDGDEIDTAFVAAVRRVAPRASLTFHRAFDVLGATSAQLETLIDLGVDRVLTSGGRRTVSEGLGRLRELVEVSAGRIEIMAGGGVDVEDIAPLLAAGVDAVHSSARVAEAAASRGDGVLALGRPDRTDASVVQRLRELVYPR